MFQHARGKPLNKNTPLGGFPSTSQGCLWNGAPMPWKHGPLTSEKPIKTRPPHNKLTSWKILGYALRVGTCLSASPSTFRQFSIHIGRLGWFEGAVCWNLRESTNIAITPIILAVMADNWCTNKDSTMSFTAPTGIPLSNGESFHIYYCIHHYLVV